MYFFHRYNMFSLNFLFLLVVFLFNTEESKCTDDWLHFEEKPNSCECGISPILTEYISHGDVVRDMKTYPWLVTLHDARKTNSPVWGYCDGALISQDTVLTAAHCVYVERKCPFGQKRCPISVENMQVGLLGPSTLEPARKVNVKKIIIHPMLSHLHNDVAIIKLAEVIPCTEYSRPICITDEDISKENRNLLIAGWGKMQSFERNDVLRDGKTTVVEESYCSMFGVKPFETICTYGKSQHSCQGGSGSPAIILMSDRYYAVGITSGGVPNCLYGLANFYTKVAPYYEFIENAMASS